MHYHIDVERAEIRARIDDLHRTAVASRSTGRLGTSVAARMHLRAVAGAALVRLGLIVLGGPRPATPEPVTARR